MKKEQEFEACADRLKALADADRLRIITQLFAGSRTVTELAEPLGETVVNVSHHLAVLRRAKVLLATKRGRFVEYSIHPDVGVSLPTAGECSIDLGCCCLRLENDGESSAH